MSFDPPIPIWRKFLVAIVGKPVKHLSDADILRLHRQVQRLAYKRWLAASGAEDSDGR
jgi:hypothetical protein